MLIAFGQFRFVISCGVMRLVDFCEEKDTFGISYFMLKIMSALNAVMVCDTLEDLKIIFYFSV